MELQFVGDIKAVRVGDKFRATGKLQSRRTGNYIEVATEIDIPAMMAEARSVYNAARAYLSAQGQQIEALPSDEGSIEGMGSVASVAKNIFDPLHVFHKEKGGGGGGGSKQDRQMVRMRQQQQQQRQQQQFSTKLSASQKALADEKKKQIVQAKARSEADRRMAERRIERAGYEEKLKELKDQIASSAADASRQAELEAQAAQFEALLARQDDATANMQAQYEGQLLQLQAMPAAQVAALPQVAPIAQAVDAQAEAEASIEGMGGFWSFMKNVAKKFKKAVAVVFRSKIVKGLVKAAGTVYGGPAGGKLAENAYGGATKMIGGRWKVPGLGITAENARVWIRLLESAKAGDAHSRSILNRVKLMARLRHPKAVKTFWMLRDIERLLPEVKESLKRGDVNLTEDPSASEQEPTAVPTAMLGIQLLGMGASESQAPVKVRCVEFNPVTMGWEQIPFSMALGKKMKRRKLSKAQQKRQAATKAAMTRARATQGRNQPTAGPQVPGAIPATSDPYYGQPSGTTPGYPPGYGPYDQSADQGYDQSYDPYGQGYDPYQQANYGPGAAQAYDPYSAAYAATPPNYDPYAQSYASQAQAYGDYSAVQNQPGFDPYSAASYGY